MAKNAQPKIDAWAANEKSRLGGPNLTRIDSRIACDGNPQRTLSPVTSAAKTTTDMMSSVPEPFRTRKLRNTI
jgi:hypothetical protein